MKLNKKAFTLIEILIVMTILVILSMTAFIPYSHYQNKLKLKIGTKEISKSLYDARNLAINGSLNTAVNSSIGLYLDALNNKIIYFSFPYLFTGSQISPNETAEIKKINEIILPNGVEINNISGKNNALFYFSSITGDGEYFYFDNIGEKKSFTGGIYINISYGNSDSPIFKKEITYFTGTYIVDY